MEIDCEVLDWTPQVLESAAANAAAVGIKVLVLTRVLRLNDKIPPPPKLSLLRQLSAAHNGLAFYLRVTIAEMDTQETFDRFMKEPALKAYHVVALRLTQADPLLLERIDISKSRVSVIDITRAVGTVAVVPRKRVRTGVVLQLSASCVARTVKRAQLGPRIAVVQSTVRQFASFPVVSSTGLVDVGQPSEAPFQWRRPDDVCILMGAVSGRGTEESRRALALFEARLRREAGKPIQAPPMDRQQRRSALQRSRSLGDGGEPTAQHHHAPTSEEGDGAPPPPPRRHRGEEVPAEGEADVVDDAELSWSEALV